MPGDDDKRPPGGGAREAAERRNRGTGLCGREAGAPSSTTSKADDGLHFLAVPFNSGLAAAYVPTRLTAADYPGPRAAGSAGRDCRSRRRAGCRRTSSKFPSAIAMSQISSMHFSPGSSRCWNPVTIRNGRKSISRRSFRAGAATRLPNSGCGATCRWPGRRTRRI